MRCNLKKLIIFGIGEFAQIAYEYFTHDSNFEIGAFVVDKKFMPEKPELFGLPIIQFEKVKQLFPPEDNYAFVAIPLSGMNVNREEMCIRVKSLGYVLATYISSKAFVWHNVQVGENSFIFEGNVLQPWVTVGDRCILWSGNHVGHRTVIENDVFISSHSVISGYCRIGHHSFMGVNSTVNDHITIAEFSFVGAASHINRDTQANKVYVGSPGKPLSGIESRDLGK